MSPQKPPYKTRKFAKDLGSSLKTSELPLKTSEVLLYTSEVLNKYALNPFK